jgi:hypothetical protein
MSSNRYEMSREAYGIAVEACVDVLKWKKAGA